MASKCEYCQVGCCEITLKLLDIPMRCIHLSGGRCQIQDDKPFSCALYPFMLIVEDGDVLFCVDVNCPQWNAFNAVEALQYIEANTESAVILSRDEVEWYGFNPVLLGKVNGEGNRHSSEAEGEEVRDDG